MRPTWTINRLLIITLLVAVCSWLFSSLTRKTNLDLAEEAVVSGDVARLKGGAEGDTRKEGSRGGHPQTR